MMYLFGFLLLTLSIPDAEKALEQQNFQKAIKIYKNVLVENPSSYEARYGLARAHAFAKNYPKAINHYTILLKHNPKNPDVLLGRGRVYLWQEKFDAAKHDLRLASQAAPNYPGIWHALGDAHLWSDDYPSALSAYSKWIALQPNNPEPYIARAKTYLQRKQTEKATADLLKAKQQGADPATIERLLPSRKPQKKPGDTKSAPSEPQPTYWEWLSSYGYTDLDRIGGDWQTIKTAIARKFRNGYLKLEGIGSRRYGFDDESIAADGYMDLWKDAYGNIRLELTNDANILPHFEGRVELFQGFGKGWEMSGSYRHMGFSDNEVNLYGIGLGKYIGSFYVREKTTFSTGIGDTDIFQSLMIRYYLTAPDEYIHCIAGIGDESVIIGSGPRVESRSTEMIALGFQKFLTESLGIFANLEYQGIEKSADRKGVEFGIRIRW